MKISDIEVTAQAFPLVRPYRIANKTIDSVSNCIVIIRLANGIVGMGAGAPVDFVTGETMEKCLNVLQSDNLQWLLDQSIYALPALTNEIQSRFSQYTPASAAALDIALYDAYAKFCDLPLVDVLGRVHHALPTSITIGIKDTTEAIYEAKEYIARGFKILKVKLGEELQKDIELVHALRMEFRDNIKIRVDMNQGYSVADLKEFLNKTAGLNIELIEQPFKKSAVMDLNQFEDEIKNKIALDENLVSVQDMYSLICRNRLAGIINIKLMKCGGITPGLNIAKLADYAGIDVMWGCMDESIISISAALHAAFASIKTKYLDLDGSFDLLDDLVKDGFVLEDGYLHTTNKPGLGFVSIKHI